MPLETCREKRFARSFWFILTASALSLSACSENRSPVPQMSRSDSLSWGVLIPATAPIGRSWEIPRNPLVGQTADDSAKMKSVLRGFALFTNTSKLATPLSGSTMSCNNCHPNGGQREKAMPLVGIDKIFPEYNKRAGRIFTLEDRIVGCLLRSINATGSRTLGTMTRHESELNGSSLNAETREVRDLASYITWLSTRLDVGKQIPWRGQNSLPPSALIPVKKLNPKLGKALYDEWCSYCHGKDGQGVDFFGRRPGPLWGPNSWNDGAGAARTYTLAGMIRNWMPYINPGRLTDEQAQHIAAYITSQPRPNFPYKNKDYLKEKVPADAVYYKQLYGMNPLIQK